jgi:hypothetical protein
MKDWSLTSLKVKLIKIGANVVSHRRYVAFQTENSPLFGSRPGDGTLRSASANHGDASALQNTAYCSNLSLTENLG